MATEIEIPVSVSIKKGEREDDAFSSEFLDGKVTEHPENKVKQLESFESSSHLAETVNTQLESDKRADEGGIFFQALSVPVVISEGKNYNDEGKEPEIVKTIENVEKDNGEIRPSVETQTKVEDGIIEDEKKDDDGQMKSEETGSEKAESEGLKVKKEIASEDEDREKEENDQDNGDEFASSQDAINEDIKETTSSQQETTVACFKKQDLNETDDKSVDAHEASEQSEQKPVETVDKIVPSYSEIEKEEQTVEIDEKMEQKGLLDAITTDTSISTQTKSQVETTKHQKNYEADDGQKEACEETALKKIESEKEVELSEGSSMKLEEKEITILNKDDDQEKEQEVNVSEKSQEKNHYSESSEPELAETKEIIEKDTQEIEYNVNTLEKTERLIHAVPTDVCISTETEPEEKTPKNEEKNDKEVLGSDDDQTKKSNENVILSEEDHQLKAESEGLEVLDSMAPSRKEIASEDGDREKEENDQGNGDEVTSSQGATSEDIKETTTSQHATTVAYFKEQDLNETDDKSVDAHEASEQSEQKLVETVDEIAPSYSEIEQEEQTEVITPVVEIDEKMEQKGSLDAITTDTCIPTQTKSQVETTEHEKNDEEDATASDDGQKEKSGISLVKEVCEETASEKVESEKEVELSDSSSMKLEEKEIPILNKDDDQEKEQAVNVSEKSQEKNHYSESSEPEVAETKEIIEKDTQEIEDSVKTLEKTERLIHDAPTDVCISTEPEPEEKTPKNEEKSDKEVESEEVSNLSDNSHMVSNENVILSEEDQDKLYVSEKGQSGADDVTSSQNASSEYIKETKTIQHATTPAYFEEGKDLNVTPIDTQEESEQCENEAKDEREQKEEESVNKIVHSSLEIKQEDDTEEIKSSDKKLEQQELLHVITADASKSTQTESHVESEEHEEKNEEDIIESNDGQKENFEIPLVKEACEDTTSEKAEYEEVKHSDTSDVKLDEREITVLRKDEDQESEQKLKMSEKTQVEDEVTTKEETTEKHEEKNDEEAIECDDDQTNKSKSPLVEVCKETVPEKANEYEEVLIHSDSSSMVLNENEIVSKDENQEKEQEFYVSEKGQCGGDDVTSSQNVSSEDIKEMIGQDASEVAYLEEVQGLNAMAKDISKEEAEDRTIVPQEASEQDENGANDKREQKPEEIIHSHSEIGEATIKEDETAGGTQNISPENKDDTIANESKSTEGIMQDDFYATHEQKSIDALEQEKSISGELQARVEKELQEDLKGHQLEDSKSENPCTTEQYTLEEVGEKTIMKPEEITKQAFQESQSEKNKEIEVKLDAENQDEVVRTEKMSSELGQPMEQNVEEIDACRTTTMSEKTEDEIAEKNEDLSLGNIDDTEDNTVKEEKSFLDGRTREIEISTIEHEPIEEKTTVKPEEITKRAFQESEIETNKKIEDKLETERSEMKDEVVLAEKMSSELGQPIEQNVEEIQACQTTTMSEKIEDEIAEKDQDLSLGSKDNTDDNTIPEEKSFLDERTREIEISTLEHEPVGEKTTINPEEITIQAFRECQSETNKEIEAKDTENQVEEREDRSEMKDEVLLTENMSSELGQPMEQNVGEIRECETTTMSEKVKVEDEITEKVEDLSLGSIDDTNDNTIKEAKSFLDGRAREIEISTLEHEPVGEKTTINPEEITIQAFHESQSETNKEIEAKLDAENQVDRREDRSEMKDEVLLTEKVSSELGQPMEQNVEEVQACQTTTMSEKVEDEIPEKVEDLSLGSIDDTNDNTIKEEKSFLDERTRDLEIPTLEHEPVGDKTTINPGDVTIQAFHESQSETNKEIEAKLDAKNQADEKEHKSEMKDEVVLEEKVSLELGQPMEQNVEEIQACQTTTMSEKVEDEISKKAEDLSLGSIDDTDHNTIKEEKSFLDERTRELEISTLEHEPVGEKTTIKPEEITAQAFHESQSETNKEIEAKLDVEIQADGREDKSEMKDEVVLAEKVSSKLGQSMEQNVEIQACRTTTMGEKVEDEIPEKVEDLSLGSIDDTDDNTIKEEKSFLDERTRDLEISTLEHEPVEEKTTIKPEEITVQAFHESQSETSKEIEGKLDVENQANGRDDRSEMKDEVVLAEKVSSELGQPMEQNVEEIQACRTTTMSEKVEDEIPKKVEDLSLGSIDDTNDNTIKEEKIFLDERTRELEISTLEHESGGEKTTINPEETTIQALHERQSETNKEIEAKDAENQVDGREDRCEMKDEVLLTKKVPSELGQPMEQNIEEIQACQTTTISEKIEDEIIEKNEDLSHGNIEDTNDNTTIEEKSFFDGRTREIEISTLEHESVEEKTGGLDEVSKQKYTDLNEATTAEHQEDSIPSTSPRTSTEDTPSSEKSKAESENLPIDLDSVSKVEIPTVVPKSEDSNLKEDCLISATAISVDDERGTVTKEISSDEISHSDPRAVEIPEVVADSEESIMKEECIVLPTAEHTDENNGEEEQEIKTNDISSAEKKEQTTESKQVVEHPSTMCPDAVLIEENIEQYGELKPTSELMIDEDRVDETKAQPEQSDITSENIMKYQTLESKLEHTSKKDLNRSWDMEEDVTLAPENQINSTEDQNETNKNVILKENVVVETEKEEGRRDSEEDNCPKELEKTSTSNLKELANEIEYSQSIPIENTEVAEVKAESQREVENIPENFSCLPEASSSERVPILEDAKALELQVNLPEIESIDTSSNDQDGIETIEQKGVLISQLKDREILEEVTENRKEAPNHDFEKEEKDDGVISEIQTPEEILKMEVKEEHLEATNDSCETHKGGLSSEKLLDEFKEIDAKEDTEITVSGKEKAAEDSYQDAVAEVTTISQTEEKLVSMVPPEELTSPTAEDQTNELVTETDKTKVQHGSISNKDWNLEEFTKTLSEDQRSVEKYIEEEGQGNFGVENKEAKSGNEVVEDVPVNEVLLEVEKAKESKSIKDNINEEASSIPNQLTSAIDEVCQIKSNSSPNELLEAKDSVEDIGDSKLMAENLNLKAEESTIMKGPTEDMKQDVENTSAIVASEFERLENMVTEEKMIEEDANKEKETLDEPQADDPAKTTSDSISGSTKKDKDVTSEESSSHGDMHKLEEEPTKVDEIVAEGKEVSAVLTENLQEASPEMIPVKHDPEATITIEKIEEEIKDKDETLVNVDFPTSTKEVPCLSNQKTGELQVSTLNTEIDEGKQDGGAGDMLNKEREAVQPHEHISDIKFVDPPSDVEIREQEELMHCGSQEPSEDNALLSQNDKKIADVLIQPSVQTEIIQGVDKRLEEAPAIDDQKHENDLDYTAKARSVDVVSNAESPKIEQEHLDTKEATAEAINQEKQSEQKKEADENIQSDIPIEKVPKQTTAHKEIADEFLVMPVAKEEDESDKVKKAEPIGIQEETMAEGNLHEEETEKTTNITEATVNLHHGEKGDETNGKATNTEAEIPTEYVKSSDVELKGDMDVPVPKCASTRNPEVRSAILEVLSGMDATAEKTAEAHVAEKGVLEEDVHLESTCNRSKTTEKVSETNQEPFNLPLTEEKSMELDAPVTPGTAATENVEISKEYVTDDLMKISQIQPELQKSEVSPDKPYQNESMESKLLSGNIDASHEQGEPTAKSLNSSDTEPQRTSEVVKEEKKIRDEKDKSEPATNDVLHESTQGNSKVAENLIEERESAPTKDPQVDSGAKTDEEDEAEEDDEDNQKMGSYSDAPVMVEASKDMEIKVHKKSHNILSGVGSKVKHSIAKVKKAITGKSSHPKPPSPKERE